MLRTFRCLAVVVSILLAPWPLRADDSRRGGLEQEQEVQGLFFLRIPFGQGKAPERPSFGVDLNMRSEAQRQHTPDRYDPKSGRRIPDQDPDKVRTWELE